MGIAELAKEYGVRNLRIFAPMSPLQYAGIICGIAFRSSNVEEEDTECVICEDRYKVDDNYKVTLKAVDPMFGKDHFYQSDFDTMCDGDERYRIYVLTIDGYQRIA
jgi:hypothetical protein